mgnify:CR=1 FL=1
MTPNQEQAEIDWQRLSYLSMVWGQFKKNRLALVGLYAVLVLLLLAIYAPFISSNQPFYLSVRGDTSFPFWRGLFNRLLYENAVDILFNLALVLSPLYLVAFVLLKRGLGARFFRLRVRVLGMLVGSFFALYLLMLPESFLAFDNPLHRKEKVTNFTHVVQELDAKHEAYAAWFPPLRYGYRDTDPARNVEPPTQAHWLGTDTEGRDVFTRMLFGTRISLTIGVVAVSIYVGIGLILGALAGYFAGWVDMLISRLIEVMICFPSFFLILTIAALIEQRSIFHVMLIIGVTSWTGVARLIRAEFLKHRSLEYAQAALALGIPRFRIMFRHILPNAIAPVLVSATFGVASAILIESSLAFLGIGDLTVASWGETLNAGRLEQKLWLILAPGFAIFFVVSVFNLVGEGLRDALDPKLKT